MENQLEWEWEMEWQLLFRVYAAWDNIDQNKLKIKWTGHGP